MLHIIKDIVVNVLSVVIVGILAFCSVFLVVELNYIGMILSVVLVGIYIFLLCYFYKKIFSKRLFVSFEFITSVFWIAMLILVNHMSSIGYWENELFGGLTEFLTCLAAVIISAITFVVTTMVLLIKRKVKKH
ncbi:MAG: hypothetical protein E7314_07150 [Clostridiales bacterium]|nr:hypothetical protein [Clostridiales bacterium]